MEARQIKPPIQFIPAGGEIYDAEGNPTFIDFSPHVVPADQPHPLDKLTDAVENTEVGILGEIDPKAVTEGASPTSPSQDSSGTPNPG